MSTPGRGPIRCPRCDAEVEAEQDWCLRCGAPARTRLAPRPNWKLPVGVLAAVLTLALLALAVAFVALTDDDEVVPAPSTAATGPTGPTLVPVVPPPAPTGPTGPTLRLTGPTGPAR